VTVLILAIMVASVGLALNNARRFNTDQDSQVDTQIEQEVEQLEETQDVEAAPGPDTLVSEGNVTTNPDNVNPNSPSKTGTLFRFTSPTLKVTFTLFVESELYELTIPPRTDTRIHVGGPSSISDLSEGQWVEFFEKNPNETLSEAISKQFLQGYDPAKCYVSDSMYAEFLSGMMATDYEIQSINFPIDQTNGGPWWEQAGNCPPTYTTTNGVSFFYMDLAYPDRYAYFKIGQYSILGNADNESWFNTFEFTD
jgi:hypothetical protein